MVISALVISGIMISTSTDRIFRMLAIGAFVCGVLGMGVDVIHNIRTKNTVQN